MYFIESAQSTHFYTEQYRIIGKAIDKSQGKAANTSALDEIIGKMQTIDIKLRYTSAGPFQYLCLFGTGRWY